MKVFKTIISFVNVYQLFLSIYSTFWVRYKKNKKYYNETLMDNVIGYL